MTSKEYQKKNLEAIFNEVSFSPVFHNHPKYCVNQFASQIPYISYGDVMNYKFIIRGRPKESPKLIDTEEREIIKEYSNIDELVNDEWCLD